MRIYFDPDRYSRGYWITPFYHRHPFSLQTLNFFFPRIMLSQWFPSQSLSSIVVFFFKLLSCFQQDMSVSDLGVGGVEDL
ncbi:hypothetical protein L1987_36496 [Smallanthus sonchifolius]|uniref:Uncharacterized protein n=1 Tax=Smallanthus sonchifolius TaxID=185202 RepID=A0ACB9HEK7_9ASTR|nr:hypothetical protein L1987_36496 [Smallanthus sonchifolius]